MRAIGRILGVVIVAALLASCTYRSRDTAGPFLTATGDPDTSPLQLRQLQVRDYPVKNDDAVMRAVIASLQDEGFTITGADADLGLISATLEAAASRRESRRQRRYWFAADPSAGSLNRRLEASISVYAIAAGTRVRLGFVSRDVAEDGDAAAETVSDPAVYQDMFSRLDRAVFFELQRL